MVKENKGALQVITPTAEAKWFNLWEDWDLGFQEKNKDNPKQKIVVRLDPKNPSHLEFIEQVQAWEKANAKSKNYTGIIKEEVRKDDNEVEQPTGYYTVTFKTGFEVPVFNTGKDRIPTKPEGLGFNPEVRVAGSIKWYSSGANKGFTGYLNQVQLVSLGETGGGDCVFDEISSDDIGWDGK